MSTLQQTTISPAQIVPLIDHTLLKPDATPYDLRNFLNKMVHLSTTLHARPCSVCIRPCDVIEARKFLDEASFSNVAVCTVVGFPNGTSTTSSKVSEAVEAIRNGAREIDMVINRGLLKAASANDYHARDLCLQDIREVVPACRRENPHVVVKVIFETCELDNDQIRLACDLCVDAAADFVKTSTGFGKAGATTEAVAIMRERVGAKLGVKASGGIRTVEDATAMHTAGATRIGASEGLLIDIANRLSPGGLSSSIAGSGY